jgi:hypothetical protein
MYVYSLFFRNSEYTFSYTHTYAHTCIHTHIHTHTHTYIKKYIYSYNEFLSINYDCFGSSYGSTSFALAGLIRNVIKDRNTNFELDEVKLEQAPL